MSSDIDVKLLDQTLIHLQRQINKANEEMSNYLRYYNIEVPLEKPSIQRKRLDYLISKIIQRE